MLVFEFKAYGKSNQFNAVDEAIRTAKFVRNSCIRYDTDSKGTTIENHRFLIKGEKILKGSGRRVSRKVKGSKNRSKARQILGKRHLNISRQSYCTRL